jgi:hypothetical protein
MKKALLLHSFLRFLFDSFLVSQGAGKKAGKAKYYA